MIVYNVTIKVEFSIADAWLKWLKEEHIPEVMATGYFNNFRILRLLDEEEDGITHTIQYETGKREKYEAYIERHAPMLRDKSFEKWGTKFIGFRSLMQLVN
ncbi:MAG: DUF4286 family protein [Ferruginibacter sp.]